MDRTEAYKIVFDELCKCPMFMGRYDAIHGNKVFMYGISTVMENIACEISDDIYDSFSDTFTHNMTECEEKANEYFTLPEMSPEREKLWDDFFKGDK